MTNTSIRPDEIIRRAHAVGAYYGFVPFASLALQNRANASREPYPPELSLDTLDPVAREVTGFLKQVRNAGLAPLPTAPLFVWHTNASPGRAAPREIVVQFHALSADRPIADAVLIRAVRSFVADIGRAEPILRINSMGDKETRARYARELSGFFRKHDATLPPDCIACAKKDVLEAAELFKGLESAETLPSPMDHLSETSRKHFERLLEYLEATETPYALAPELLSRGGAWADTCFEIASDDVRAWGSRYLELARPFFKTITSSVGALVRLTPERRAVIPSVRDRAHPRFVFVHIGEEAKRESMKMADDLRRARISLTQSIGTESLTEQMHLAERLNPPYLLIMGRKEAMEGSVILRERSTHIESIIPLASLILRLKKVA